MRPRITRPFLKANSKGSPWPGNESESVQRNRAGANLSDYEEGAEAFSWAQGRGLPGGLNIAHEAVERHVQAGRGDKLALRWIGREGRRMGLIARPTVQYDRYLYLSKSGALNAIAAFAWRHGLCVRRSKRPRRPRSLGGCLQHDPRGSNNPSAGYRNAQSPCRRAMS